MRLIFSITVLACFIPFAMIGMDNDLLSVEPCLTSSPDSPLAENPHIQVTPTEDGESEGEYEYVTVSEDEGFIDSVVERTSNKLERSRSADFTSLHGVSGLPKRPHPAVGRIQNNRRLGSPDSFALSSDSSLGFFLEEEQNFSPVEEDFSGFGEDMLINIDELKQKIENKENLAQHLLKKAGVKNLDKNLLDECLLKLEQTDEFEKGVQHLLKDGQVKKKVAPGSESGLLDMLKEMAFKSYIETLQENKEKVSDDLVTKTEEIAKKIQELSTQKKWTVVSIIGGVIGTGAISLIQSAGSWVPVLVESLAGGGTNSTMT